MVILTLPSGGLYPNIISSLRDVDGKELTLDQDIGEAFSSYYANLWAFAPSNTDFTKCPLLPSLSAEGRSYLLLPFTSAEIICTLHQLPKGKAPGPDGYPAEFFQRCWHKVGPLVLRAFSHFFATGILPSSWSMTLLAFIPC